MAKPASGIPLLRSGFHPQLCSLIGDGKRIFCLDPARMRQSAFRTSKHLNTTPHPANKPGGASVLPVILLAAYTLLGCLILAVIDVFPSQDGPLHIHTARLLIDRCFGTPPLFAHLLDYSFQPDPNWFCQFVLAVGLLFWPGEVAERMMLASYLLCWPVCLIGGLRAIGVRSIWPALFALPLVLNHFVFLGFYNFAWSIPFMFLALCLWLRGIQNNSACWLAAASAASVLVYFCHILSALQLLLLCGVFLGWRILTRSCSVGRITAAGAALLPTFLLCAGFLLQENPGPPGSFSIASPMPRLGSLLGSHFLIPTSTAGIYAVTVPLMILVLCALSAGLRSSFQAKEGRAISPPWLLCLTIQLCLVLLAPDSAAGGSMIAMRLPIYAWLTVIVMIALLWEFIPLRAFPALAAATAAFLLAGFAWRAVVLSQTAMNTVVEWLHHVPHGGTLMISSPSSARQHPPETLWRHRVLVNIHGRVADSPPYAICIDSYQFYARGFPIRLAGKAGDPSHRTALDPYTWMLDRDSFTGTTGIPIDSLLYFKSRPEDMNDEAWEHRPSTSQLPGGLLIRRPIPLPPAASH